MLGQPTIEVKKRIRVNRALHRVASGARQLCRNLAEREVVGEARVWPVHDGTGLFDEFAAGRTVAKRVEEITARRKPRFPATSEGPPTTSGGPSVR